MKKLPHIRQISLKKQLIFFHQETFWLLQSKFQDICGFCKNIGRRLSNYIAHYSKIEQSNQLSKIFGDCLENIQVLVQSTSRFKEYFQFPYLAFILQKIKKMGLKFQLFIEEKVSLRIEKNQQSFYQKNINLRPITKCQLKFLSSQYINNTILEIINNQLILPNNQCVLCSPVFIKDFEIFNSNCCFPVMIGLSKKQAFNKVQLYKYLCAVCNQGGGLIIVGAQRRRNSIYATGISLKDENQILEKIKQIQEVCRSHIRPQFYLNVYWVRVHNNFVDRQNFYQQKYRYCLKIAICLSSSISTCYIELSNKGYHNLYQSYKLEDNKVTELLPGNKKINFYSYIHCKYRKYMKKQTILVNSHNKIQCSSPQLYCSKLFIDYWNCMTQYQRQKAQKQYINEQQVVQQLDELKFKYKNNSLLTVGSKAKDKFVKEFQIFANSKKIVFQLFKPFMKYFKQGQISIWMLSHVDNYQIIRSILKQTDKQGYITLIPVHKTLQIDKSKISQHMQYIENTFKQKYPEGFQLYMKNITYQGKQREVLFFQFNSYTHSIYGFIIFSSLQLKPYFVKDNTEYKKNQQKW